MMGTEVHHYKTLDAVSRPGRSQRNDVLQSSPVQSTTVTVLELRGGGSASLWFDLQTGPASGLSLKL